MNLSGLEDPYSNSKLYNWLQKTGGPVWARACWDSRAQFIAEFKAAGVKSYEERQKLATDQLLGVLKDQPEPEWVPKSERARTKKAKSPVTAPAENLGKSQVLPADGLVTKIDPNPPVFQLPLQKVTAELEAKQRERQEKADREERERAEKLAQEKAAAKERTRLQAAKDKLSKSAGSSKILKEWVEWAVHWQPIVLVEGVIHWDRIEGSAPSVAAVGLLEEACRDYAGFFSKFAKSLGAGDAEDDDMRVKERKREVDLLRLLDELDAELAEKGEEAYA